MNIRRARPEDLQLLLGLERAIFPHPWSRAMIEAEIGGEPGRISLVAETDTEAVGFAFCWRVADELHLVNLGVLPGRRRHGIGQALLKAILDQPEAAGATIMTLEVRRSNREALSFYERHAFRAVALRPRYYPDGEEAVIMIRPLERPPRKEPLSDPAGGA